MGYVIKKAEWSETALVTALKTSWVSKLIDRIHHIKLTKYHINGVGFWEVLWGCTNMIINIELTSYLIFAKKDMIIAAQKNAHLGFKWCK